MKLLATLAVLVAGTISSASATLITYNTSGSTFTGAGFTTGTGTQVVTLVSGLDTVTLAYTGPGPGPANVTVNSPTNVSYGFIQLTFAGNPANTINLPAFTFNLVVNNVTDSTTAAFLGTAAASTIAANASTLNLNWTPAAGLVDGTALFSINTPTSIPSDNTLFGQASLQGSVTSAPNATPEPGTMLLMGAGLVGVGFTARKKFASRS